VSTAVPGPAGRRRLTVRTGPGALGLPALAIRIDLRLVVVLAATALLTLAAFTVGLALGDFPISPPEVLATLLGQGSPQHEFIVLQLRLPRVLVAILVGAAFALSGALFQSLARNPLVAPDVIGINAGAALLAVGVIVLGMPAALLAPAAFCGALGAALLLYALAYRGGVSTYRLVLVGIAVNAGLTAGISYLLTRGDIEEVQRANVWLIGSIYASDWADVRLLGLALLVLVPAALALGRRLEALQLGDDLARALGAPVERTRLALVVVAVALAALSVSVAGPIAFVAFIAPHIARRLAATSGAGALPASAAVGALLMLVSDIVAQRLLAPTSLPVGIVTAVLGAPYFLYLLRRAGRLGVTV
jgi:iron complex transport system permease protein